MTRLREVRAQISQPKLWLCGHANSLDFPGCIRLSVSWDHAQLRGARATSVPLYVFMGHSIEDYVRLFRDGKEPATLESVLFLGEDGTPLDSPMTNDPLFLPSPKFIAASVTRGAELLAQHSQGIVFRMPHVPATTHTLAQLTNFTAARSKSTPANLVIYEQWQRTEAYDACLLAADRFVQGLRDLASHKNSKRANIWLATSSLPVLACYQCITPFFGLDDATHPDGLVVFIHPLKDDVLQTLPTALRPSSFEWVLCQTLAAHAAAELLNCPLVIAPLDDGGTTPPLTIEAIIAAQLVGSRAELLALGAATLPTVESDGNDKPQMTSENLRDDWVETWSVLGNFFTSQNQERVRWDSGSRDVALGITDGLLIKNSAGVLGELLALWLPCLHEGLPVRLMSLSSLAEPRLSRNVRTVLTSFSFQCPRRTELIALAEWVKRGGSLVLFGEGGVGSGLWDFPNDQSLRSGAQSTTVSAEASFFSYLGFPPVISDGVYRVGDGWVLFSSRTLDKIISTSEYFRVPQAVAQIAQASRRPISSRPVWAVYRDDVVAGAYIGRNLAHEWTLKGMFIDLTTSSLPLSRNPSYRKGNVFLLRKVPRDGVSNVEFLAANVPLVSRDSSVGRWNFQKVVANSNRNAVLQAVFFAPPFSYAVEDADTGEGLNFEYAQPDHILRVLLCPETTSLMIGPVP
ncbi:MAG: hypothetical protein ACP5UB_03950 [Candidatus Sumerlaeaceae bacterium]